MKKIKITIYLLLFVCLSIFGQQPKIVSIQGQPQKTSTQVTTNQQESIKQLQAENEAMKAQLDRMEKEIELYRGDVRAKVADFNDDLSQWLTIMGLMMAVIGIAIPLILSRRNENFMERMLDDVKQQANSAEKQAQEATTQAVQAKQAVVDIEGLKKHVTAIEERINKDAIAAEKAAKEAKASQLFTEALAEHDKNPVRAIELYTQAILLDPVFAGAYNNRAILNTNIGNLNEALDDFNKAIELTPDNSADIYNNRGNLKSSLGDTNGAMADYEKAIELNPNSPVAFSNRAFLKMKKGDKRGALDDFNKSITCNPDFADAYFKRGNLKYEMNDSKSALEDFNKTIELVPTHVDALFNRGILKSNMGDDDGAFVDYCKVIEIRPGNAKAYNNLANILLRKGEYAKALEYINIAIMIDKNSSVCYVTRGEILAAQNNDIGAVSDFSFAILIDDNLKEAYVNRAKCYRTLAGVESDVEKKAELIDKAEADEKKAESLKEVDKA
jgi:tetratricopeptide (TPR) repeat protein